MSSKLMKAIGGFRPMSPVAHEEYVVGEWRDGFFPIQWQKTKNGEKWWLFGIECKLTETDVIRIWDHIRTGPIKRKEDDGKAPKLGKAHRIPAEHGKVKQGQVDEKG